MDLDPKLSMMALILVAFAGLATASSFISDDVLVPRGSGGRSLLQTPTNCPLSFEFLNYTIITSQCKGPLYPVDLCCGAFKEFACPYAAELNDLTNNCATNMFTYINLYGKYPPGLFSSECRDDKIGLVCPASAPQSQEDASSGYMNRQSLMSVIFLACGVVLKCLLS
ncbi:GPI-anchored protein LLG1-like isoform X2 [Musa acuminata AAA Group]|uniref:GPI-anchored protein LLG1-like isoform X2 n=1 Tax=Musa acuminata AAA Group TaxID=214697 RepID=UPI0031E1AB8A